MVKCNMKSKFVICNCKKFGNGITQQSSYDSTQFCACTLILMSSDKILAVSKLNSEMLVHYINWKKPLIRLILPIWFIAFCFWFTFSLHADQVIWLLTRPVNQRTKLCWIYRISLCLTPFISWLGIMQCFILILRIWSFFSPYTLIV